MIFDVDSTLTLDEISKDLVQGLPSELNDPRPIEKLWTKEVADRLYKMGKERGMFVCCHGSLDNVEWLLDVIWMVQRRHEIVLAVESEWGSSNAILYDFEKLMPIKARHKLLLFGEEYSRGSEVVHRLEGYMQEYPHHLEGEEYMALNVNAERAYRYRFQVPGTDNGHLNTVRFNEIEPLHWPWKPR